MTIYGHLHLNYFFVNVLELTDSGLIYKGKSYRWSDIVKIKRESIFLNLLMNGRYPRATIFLSDGSKIRINCRAFTRKGESSSLGFAGFFTQESKAFSEFISLIDSKLQNKYS